MAEARPTTGARSGKVVEVVNVCYKRIEPVSIAMKRLNAADLVYPRKELGMGFTWGAPTTSVWSFSRPKIARTDASTSSPRS